MRYLRFRLGPHTLMLPLEAAISVEDGASYQGKTVTRLEGLLCPVRDLVSEALGSADLGRVAVHLARGDERAILLLESALSIANVDESAWRPLPGSLDRLAPWVDAIHAEEAGAAPAFRLATERVWARFEEGPATP
jgi:hypothetical protein